ncbi:prenylcysteine oxidase 1 [Spea bombifrons]|uniref:prenylcysteine oxidase 1 n=1 Tax=Spea bombifrons TaxID=233779 RepID=UPI002349B1F3|nr:prenylcysteine oxidase 1 [Spea bombifrons]
MKQLAGLMVAFWLFLVGSLRAGVAQELRFPPNRIAVVGAGIGGSSAAYFLRQKFGKHVQIDLFEKGEVGGRLATVDMEGGQYEAGGSVIHPLNLHMKTFVKELGLSVRAPSDSLVGIHNGEDFVFQESHWFIVNIVKMLWRYGLNFLRMYMWVEDMLDKFMRIYRYQTFDYSFSTTESLLHALGGNDFMTKLNVTVDEALQRAGFSQKFIDEIVTPAMRVNYNQGVKINGFVGAVSLAGTDSGLWSVEGGNKLVCTGLVYSSKAQLIQGTVTSMQEKVRPLKSGGTVKLYELSYETSAGPGLEMYDIVVIATPLNKDVSNISFLGFNPPIHTFSKRYQQTVATFVHGQLNSSFFGCSSPCRFEVSEILTTDNPKLFFSSVGAVSPVKAKSESEASQSAESLKVWKVFSPEPLTKDQLDLLFKSHHAVSEKKWLAYPLYSPPEKMPPVILHDRIYYVNSIELAASAMEMSAISAKNVALLAHHRWYGKDGQIDQEDLTERLKSEL